MGLPRSRRVELVDQRYGHHTPLIVLSPESQYITSRPGDSDIEWLQQVWYDHQAVSLLLQRCSAVDNLGQFPSGAMGCVFSDVMESYAQLGVQGDEYRQAGHARSRDWFVGAEDQLVHIRVGGQLLTSDALLEGGATIAELSLLSNRIYTSLMSTSDRDRFFQRYNDTVLYGRYGAPLRACFEVLPPTGATSFADVVRTCAMFIYIALNPPLPPFVMRPRRGGRAWGWHEVYPPLRFARLLRVAEALGPCPESSFAAGYESYIRKACDAAGLDDIWEYRVPPRAGSRTPLASEAPERVVNGEFWDVHAEYVLRAHEAVSAHPERVALVADFGACTQGEFSGKYAKMLIDPEGDEVYFRSPLAHRGRGKLLFGCDVATGNQLVRSVCVSHAMFDFACGTGEVEIPFLPHEVTGSDRMAKFSRKVIEAVLIDSAPGAAGMMHVHTF